MGEIRTDERAAEPPAGTARGTPRSSEAIPPLPVPAGPALLTLVVPTFNERDNLPELVRRVGLCLADVAWEIVFVDDDSPDGTARVAKELAARDPRIRCIRRLRRRGLAGACIEGMLSSSATYVAVMDGDLQHDETILPRMLAELVAGEADLVVGSRHVEGGSGKDGFSKLRARMSRSATRLAGLVLRVPLHDPMSGFFMMRRDRFEEVAPRLSTSGFKVLADIVASAPGMRIAEIGYLFRPRVAGESKLDLGVGLDFLGLVLNKLTKGVVPVRFLFFVLAGCSGLVVHLLVLRICLTTLGLDFVRAQSVATVVAMTSNFFVNNLVTYRDAKLSGTRLVRGLLLFYLVCGLGAVANVGAASWFYVEDRNWWLAGLVGALTSAVWNYSLSTVLVWRKAT